MGVYHYYRKVTVWILPCLYLLCSTTVIVVTCQQRFRHQQQQNHHDDSNAAGYDVVSQLERLCPHCVNSHRDEVINDELKLQATDNLRLEAIKRQILTKLGLVHKPNITRGLPREVIMETIGRAERDFFPVEASGAGSGGSGGAGRRGDDETEEEDVATNGGDSNEYEEFYGRTSEIITFAEKGSRVNSNRLLEFHVSPESSGQEFQVRTATFWFKADMKNYVRNSCASSDIYVFKIVSRLPETVTLTAEEFERTIWPDPAVLSLTKSSSGWQKLDLTAIVKRWLSADSATRHEKLRLFVDCNCCTNWNLHLFNNNKNGEGAASKTPRGNNQTSHTTRPFLVIRTDDDSSASARRVRRRALNCSPDSGTRCCKQRFYVDFKRIGWDDWVIAPQGYYANYCRGDCGSPGYRTPDTYVTYHTHVMEEVRKTHQLIGMQPCCAPLKFSSMSLIYYGPDLSIVKRDLPKMVVDECGCP